MNNNVISGSYLRLATMDDAELILKWANDPLDRANSRSSKIIKLEEHLKWMEAALKDPDIYLYIMVWNKQNVGHIKLYINNDIAEIGYCIAPEWRGYGLANQIIELVTDVVKRDIPRIRVLIGEVKVENIPSRKAFLHSGYKEMSIVYGCEINKKDCSHRICD